MSTVAAAPMPPGAAGAAVHPRVAAAAAARLAQDRAVYLAMAAVLLGSTVFSRFGLNLGVYSLDAPLLALFALGIAMLRSQRTRVDLVALSLYVLGVSVAAASYLVNDAAGRPGVTSPTSALLLAAMYLPLLQSTRTPVAPWLDQRALLELFSRITVLIAVCGIAQFFVQRVASVPWLFDFTPMLPQVLRGNEGYNTVIAVGDLYKSNGFFLREPSSYSFLMALGIVVELAAFRRRWRVALFALGLMLSYSGTGILALAIGLLFPLDLRTLKRVVATALVAGAAVAVLWEPLNLSFTLGRIAEFGDERSSAYIRYVAPAAVVWESFGASGWSALIGQGPGSILRVPRGFESFDPTWAKVLFEYGLLGGIAWFGLVLHLLRASPVPSPIAAVLFASWLVMGGHLLTAENVGVLFVLAGAWRAAAESRVPAPRNTTSVT